ncbi:hypothetical protein F8R89_30780 [Streptomyces sp. SS1-1]|uniref:hypothetical protein n=1 Tax=Streptomyces sp. SS1-1 TaxID=2651869 RepID=UPI00124FD449|nr:hypothetical protein [Streptomyces sp. SS1-1]KAB2975995.1 hypothetical protein F8R89_30780 [Streptomyces sp. SS1-1]
MAEPIITGLYVLFLAGFALAFWLLCRKPRLTPTEAAEQQTDDIEARLKAYATRIADLYDTTPGGNQ